MDIKGILLFSLILLSGCLSSQVSEPSPSISQPAELFSQGRRNCFGGYTEALEDIPQGHRVVFNSEYSAYYHSFSQAQDFSDLKEEYWIVFNFRSDSPLDHMEVLLIDSFLGEGDYDYQISLSLDTYYHTPGQWQRIRIPLKDFPESGMNWTRPPSDFLPHMGSFDWSNVESAGIYNYQQDLQFEIYGLAMVHRDSLNLALGWDKPWTLPEQSLDLALGEALDIQASLNQPVSWQLKILGEDSGALMEYQGDSREIRMQWRGESLNQPFQREALLIKLTAGQGDALFSVENRVHLLSTHSPFLFVSQGGYHSQETKVFRISSLEKRNPVDFELIDLSSGNRVYSGKTGTFQWDWTSHSYIGQGDFSSLMEEGEYLVRVLGFGESYPFFIENLHYEELLRLSAKSYYYQRCGMDLVEEYAGIWSREACHQNDAHLSHWQEDSFEILPESKASLGGWHDAGDFGKKTVPTSVALYHLLLSHELAPSAVERVNLLLPDPETYPDLLKECRFALDWLLTMQREDGAVYTHIVSTEFHDIEKEMPSEDQLIRFFTPVSSTATADFAAVMAMASRVYSSYDRSFSEECRNAALLSWEYLQEHRDIFPPGGYQDPLGLQTPGYADSDDRGERFWAAVEIALMTKEALESSSMDYLNQLTLIVDSGSWLDPTAFGIYSLLLFGDSQQEGHAKAQQLLFEFAEDMSQKMSQNVQGISLGHSDYFWGTNYRIAGRAAALCVIHKLYPQMIDVSSIGHHIQYLLGCNPLDFSFVTGVGMHSVEDPLQGASITDGLDPPVPGFLVPGVNPLGDDRFLGQYLYQNDLPPALCYLDDHRAYSVNEVALVFNAPLVFTCAYLDQYWNR